MTTDLDMSAVIIPKSDQINADDLIAGPMTVEIVGVKIDTSQEQPVAIQLRGTSKVYRPCKSMSRVLVQAWGPDAKAYVGRGMTLYRDPKVKWGGLEVGGIRISHMSHLDAPLTLVLTASKANRAPFRVQVLAGQPSQAPLPDPAALQAARHAAALGRDAFGAWWKAADATARAAATTIMDELKATAAAADASQADHDDPPM